ncbi:Ig-like domain repeat protein [Granulicella arctica]|uniref:Ig-like domain repeat protein n=1 Tax=Granulicella arctica TaxID=940613 RepID=UPI0021DFB422|nr:Ig-like domain repeat protein [Granulicella arctica]
MFRTIWRPLSTLLCAANFALFSVAASPAQSLPAQTNRVTVAPKANAITRLAGHLPSWATAAIANDAGPVPTAAPLRLTFVLSRSAERQAAFTQLLADQQNPASPSFHHWLTPQQIGDQYGPTQHDVDSLAAWLTSQSFTIVETAPSRTFITIASTAGTVATALGTGFRYVNLPEPNYQDAALQLKPHLTATAAPAIPTAFAALVTAIDGLSDIPAYPMLHMDTTQTQPGPGDPPQLNSNSGSHYVTPADFAILYDLNPIYSASPALTGTGQKVAIIGRSQINPIDISAYQAIAGQPTKQPNLVVPPNGADPGQTGTGDQGEATLDVQRVLGTAPAAQADLVVSSTATGGILTAMQYNVQTLLDPVMTISFGSCEALVSASTIASYDALFSQAAAEGISVFVSSGDAGAAACDTHGAAPPAAQFLSTNYLCSSGYVTCVGGTEFADFTSPATYWSATNGTGHVSVLSYIPEGAWNDPTVTDSSGNVTTYISSTGGGASIYTPKPAFQTGVGVPNDGARDTPDISFSAARHDYYFGCYALSGASCVPSNTGSYSFTGFAGTSASAPSMAAIAALLDQKLGGPQGTVNSLLYRLASSTPAAFHDTTTASSGVANCTLATPSMCNNSTPSPTALTGGQAGYALTTGYDQATGLGSLDVANFISAATKATSAASTTLTLSEMSATINPGQSDTFTATLTSSTAGSPTGTVQFYANTTPLSNPVTINGGLAVLTTQLTAAGGFTITAVYSGDGNFAPSTAPGIPLTVTGQISITRIGTTSNSILVNGADTFTATVSSAGSATATPTGLIEFVQSGSLVATVPLVNGQASTSSISFPTAGTIPVYAFYRGDTTYGSSSSTVLNIAVTAPAPTYQLSASPTTLTLSAGANGLATVTINETNFAGVVNLTCAVTYNGTGTVNFPPTCNLASNAVTINQAPGSTALTIATTTPHTSLRSAAQRPSPRSSILEATGATLACLLLSLVPIRRRNPWRALSLLLILSATLGVLSGCGGSSSPAPLPTPTPIGTTTGSYTVTVTASSGVTGVVAPAPLTIALTID